MDTAKVVSDRLNNVLINVQTVPSNCAAFTTKSIVYSPTTKSIVYSPTHEMIASVREKKPVDAVILEPKLLKMRRLNICVQASATRWPNTMRFADA